ncbi:hypothetical protein ACFYWY_00710 [Streptomyces sp. NPDC002870]|uniref:hypothetical protein n=1 Tax=Streptomyces sp. NPDC002870 TaxID=3364666 RepID=UPI0036B3C220
MITTSYERQRNLNTTIMLLVVFIAVQAHQIFPRLEKNLLVNLVIVVTSKGLYEILIKLIYRLINSSEMLLRLYWGPLFLRGCWSYEYTLNGATYFGVWEFDQNTWDFQVIGNGLSPDFHSRTIVRSVSPLIPEQGGYFVLNRRNELSNDNALVFSKTTLLLNKPRRSWHLVMTMRATTEVYGGPSDRQLHANVVFLRHPKAASIEEVIDYLRDKYSTAS